MDTQILQLVIGAATSATVGGLFFTIRKLYQIHVERFHRRQLTIKVHANGSCEIQATGLTNEEMTQICKRLPTQTRSRASGRQNKLGQ